jgi:hypothetical protein
MVQPAGRICGLPSRYRIYLASSPIVCAADAALAVVRLASTAIIRPQTAARLLLLWTAETRPNLTLTEQVGDRETPIRT